MSLEQLFLHVLCKFLYILNYFLFKAAAPLTTFDTYMTLIPRLVEIEPFQHLVSCAKAKRLLESQSGSVVPFVLVEVEKLLKDLRDFLDSLLSDEELPDHERIKVLIFFFI